MSSWRLLPLRVLAAYARHAPQHPGRWRIVQMAVRRVPSLKTSGFNRVIRLREGFSLVVDGTSQTGRIAYATGTYEPRTTSIIRSLVRPGDTVIDVGANIGYFSLVAARAVGPSGRVLAFEPVPEVRQSLIANLRLNAIEHVSVRAEALGSSAQDVVLYRGPASDTGLTSARLLPSSQTLRVQQARFDDLWDRGTRVALIKIDVEGAELRVLEGMTECLRRDQPHLILEVTDEFLRTLGGSAGALLDFLERHRYRMWEIRDDGALLPVRDRSALEACPSQFNALCSARTGLESVL